MVGGLKKLNNQKLLDVRREGAARLLDNKGNVEDARKVLNLLDDEKQLEDVLKLEKNSGEIEVTVAEEESGNNCSIVRAPITVHGQQLASIGVIGPQRMNYGAIASALKVVVDGLKEVKGDEEIGRD